MFIRRKKRIRIAWLLLSVYLPMMIAVSLHRHGEAAVADTAFYCQDCVQHVHHAGHIMPLQNAFHDCVLCQLQTVPFLSAEAVVLFAVVGACCAIRVVVCSKCRQVANGVKSLRAPPYSCSLWFN